MRDLKLNAERRREEAESLIECKNKEIDEDETKRKQMETEIESLKRKKDDLDRKTKEILIELKLSETERKNLEKHHAECEKKRVEERQEMDVISRDRDVISHALTRREEELAMTYEKIKVQRSVLAQGQRDYEARTREIKALKINLSTQTHELEREQRRAREAETLEKEVRVLTRSLTREKAKVRALSEELENPLNVHRWRQLEGSDPNAFESIQKIQQLQRRLVQKSEEVTKLEKELEDKRIQSEALRKSAEKRVTEEEQTQMLRENQAILKEKSKHLKALRSELNAQIQKAEEYRLQAENYRSLLDDMKEQHFRQKKREFFAINYGDASSRACNAANDDNDL